MPHLILRIMGLLVSVGASSQQLKVIGDQEFSSRSGQWYKKTSDGKYYKVHPELLTIKFKTDAIGNFLSRHGLFRTQTGPATEENWDLVDLMQTLR